MAILIDREPCDGKIEDGDLVAVWGCLTTEESFGDGWRAKSPPGARQSKAASLLGSDAPVITAAGETGLILRVPDKARTSPPCKHAWSFELSGAKIAPD